MRLSRVAKDLIVTRPHVTRLELVYHVEIGICAPLTYLVRDDGYVDVLERFIVVGAKPTGFTSQHLWSNALNRKVVTAFSDILDLPFCVTSPARVQAARIFLAEEVCPFCERELPVAFGLVTRRQQHERRMITVSLDHSFGFFVEHPLHRCVGTDLIPHFGLGLQIKPETVRRFKRRFGRTPRMKTHVVQSPRATELK